MSSLPEPLTTTEHNVDDLDGFMFNTDFFLNSELVAISSGDECKAAVILWCRAWKQSPAGSLPDDDRALASFAGYGKDVKAWLKVKAMALRGFVKCSDGRLYHSTLCKDVVRAAGYKKNKTTDNDRKQREREQRSQMFEQLRAAGVTPKFNTTTAELRSLVTDLSRQKTVTSGVTSSVTVTADVTAIQDRTIQDNKEKIEDDNRFAGATCDLADLEKQLRKAAGWEREPAPSLFITGPVAAVLESGVDLHLDLIPAAQVHGPKLRNRSSWNYIIQVAISNRDKRLAALSDAVNQPAGGPHGKPSKPSKRNEISEAADRIRDQLRGAGHET